MRTRDYRLTSDDFRRPDSPNKKGANGNSSSGNKHRNLSKSNKSNSRKWKVLRYSPTEEESAELIDCYKLRIRQLEKERKKLFRHIDDCHDYIEQQRNNSRKLQDKIQKMNPHSKEEYYEARMDIPWSLIHKLIIGGLIAYIIITLVNRF